MLGASLSSTVLGLLDDPATLAAMGQAARALARPDAADRIADLLFVLAGESASWPATD